MYACGALSVLCSGLLWVLHSLSQGSVLTAGQLISYSTSMFDTTMITLYMSVVVIAQRQEEKGRETCGYCLGLRQEESDL